MNPSATMPYDSSPVDEDMVEQARPGQGIPSPDPDPAAQTLMEPMEAPRQRTASR